MHVYSTMHAYSKQCNESVSLTKILTDGIIGKQVYWKISSPARETFKKKFHETFKKKFHEKF